MVVLRDGARVHTTAKEFHLLKLLMERNGRYVTKNDIEYALYDADNGRREQHHRSDGLQFAQEARGRPHQVHPRRWIYD